MRERGFPRVLLLTLLLTLLLGSLGAPSAWEGSSRETVLDMLHQIESILNHDYYDPEFHGVDMKARFAEARTAIAQTSNAAEAFGVVGLTVDALGDYSTRFVPPHPSFEIRKDWDDLYVGEQRYVSAVRPGSDAAQQGLKAGDTLLSVDGYSLKRDTYWQRIPTSYVYTPPKSVRLTFESADGKSRTIDAGTSVTTLFESTDPTNPVMNVKQYEQRASDLLESSKPRIEPLQSSALIWKTPDFSAAPELLEEGLNRAKKFPALVIDLRGSGSKNFDRLPYIVSRLFDHKVMLGELKSRGHSKPFQAGTFGKKAFAGKIAVLVDSRTSGAGEVLARLVQIEKRGVVLGDRTAGDGCQPGFRQFGRSNLYFAYGLSLCTAELVMSDGQSLRGRGVTPDRMILPTPADLAAGRDPVLAAAVSLLGGSLTPEQAGKLFPVMWLPR